MSEPTRLQSERRAALRAAMEKLPLRDGKNIAFVALCLEQFSDFYSVHDLPRLQEVSSETAATELEALATLVGKLRTHIASMHRTSLRAIEGMINGLEIVTDGPVPQEFHPLDFAEHLLFPEVLYLQAKNLIDTAPPTQLPGANRVIETYGAGGYPPKRGHPAKHHARLTAEMAARVYWDLTGKRPTITTNPNTNKRGGRFLAFLREVFDAMGIDASAEAQAVAIVRQLKRVRAPT